MGTGIFSGLIWGGATGAVVVSVLSLYAPLPKQAGAALATTQASDPATQLAPEQATPEQSNTEAVSEPEDTSAVETDAAETTLAAAPETTAPETTAPVIAEDAPEVLPEAVETLDVAEPVQEDLAQPEPAQEEAVIASTDSAPVPVEDAEVASAASQTAPSDLVSELASDLASDAPGSDALVSEELASKEVGSDEQAPAAQVRAPDVSLAGTTVRVPQTPASDSAVPGRASPLLQGNRNADGGAIVLDDTAVNAPVAPAAIAEAPVAPAIGERVAVLLNSAVTASPSTVSPNALAQPLAEAAPQADAQSATRAVPSQADAPEAEGEAETAVVTPVSSDTPIILPVPKIENPVEGVVTNRLPSVSGNTAQEAPAVEAEAEAPALDPAEVGALKAFAANFEGTLAGGVFSVVLIDVGAEGMPRDEILALELPFSIAIDPSAPGAAEAAKAYRDAGIEVLAVLNDLPAASEPADVAIALGSYFNVLDQSIAVLDPVDGRIQANRSLLQPVLGAIRDTGHGLLTYDRGLNTAQQAARREGIASATVFRLLDGEREEAPLIKRYLSRAAFTASNDGAVVVVGHSYPETVKAVLEWALDEKDAELSVAPVSTIMLGEGE